MISTIKSFNIQSAAFWSALAGAAADICAILNVNATFSHNLQDFVVAAGTLLIAIPVHHVVKAQQTVLKPPQTAPIPPVVPPVA